MRFFRRREDHNDMVTPALNADRIASAARELSVSQSKLAAEPEVEKRLAMLGVTPDEYARAVARGYLSRRSA